MINLFPVLMIPTKAINPHILFDCHHYKRYNTDLSRQARLPRRIVLQNMNKSRLIFPEETEAGFARNSGGKRALI